MKWEDDVIYTNRYYCKACNEARSTVSTKVVSLSEFGDPHVEVIVRCLSCGHSVWHEKFECRLGLREARRL